MQSVFILSRDGEVLIEKHYRGLQDRGICDLFWGEVAKAKDEGHVAPIIASAKRYLIHVFKYNMYFLSTVQEDTPPLLVMEFLLRVADVFEGYFESLSEQVIKENFVTVYQVLDEMMDNGHPFSTEPNALKELIPPPSFLRTVSSTVTGQSNTSNTLSNNRLSNTPWRTPAKYSNNEIYFDMVEEVNCIVDANGMMVTCEVAGTVTSACFLSGMPHLSLIFNYPKMLSDVSFHPCVRHNVWDQQRIISFIPPDGNFKLMDYRISSNIQPPMYCKPTITFHDGVGNFSITVGPRHSQSKPIDEVKVKIPFPKSVSSVRCTPIVGKWSFDETTKMATWEIGKLPMAKSPVLEGHITLQSGKKVPESYPTVLLEFRVNLYSVSGLKVDSLAVQNVDYKPYKGVRCITRAGKFQVRTSS